MNKDKFYLGIDIGGTSAKIALTDEDTNIIHKAEYSVSFDNYETPILDTVLNKSEEFIKSYNIEIKTIQGIGISATGHIDTYKGIVAGTGGHIKNWQGARIKEEFEKKYNLLCTVINDANAAAIGEHTAGAAKGCKNAIILTVGTGLGGGVIINDKLMQGHLGFGGEIGHFSIDKHGIQCTCGNKGCFERYSSTTALIAKVKQYFDSNNIHIPDANFPYEEITGRTIFESIKNGNEELKKISLEWIDDISKGIISLVHIFNPEIIIIGGGVSKQKELFIDKLYDKVNNKIMPTFSKGFSIKPATLGNDAGIIGAISYLKTFIKEKNNENC